MAPGDLRKIYKCTNQELGEQFHQVHKFTINKFAVLMC